MDRETIERKRQEFIKQLEANKATGLKLEGAIIAMNQLLAEVESADDTSSSEPHISVHYEPQEE